MRTPKPQKDGAFGGTWTTSKEHMVYNLLHLKTNRRAKNMNLTDVFVKTYNISYRLQTRKMATQTARNTKATAPKVRSNIWRCDVPESDPSESPKRPGSTPPEEVDLIEA